MGQSENGDPTDEQEVMPRSQLGRRYSGRLSEDVFAWI
jgi:hypothetical protein